MKETVEKEKLLRFFSGNYTDNDRSYVERVFCDDRRKESLKSFLLWQWNNLEDFASDQHQYLDHVIYKILYPWQ
ncbi:hypothetical protein QQ020_31705 [Fulvivirgaceae bacterium BMA12]|uniref:Uncharacterized protein n=1 Tax=Agaribacillus aureus TaxID=3051825 RepID=A0ABT8LK59_9BACT|nr:hypothetical protein [Fulvivirgaceae bacterium BMA12]